MILEPPMNKHVCLTGKARKMTTPPEREVAQVLGRILPSMVDMNCMSPPKSTYAEHCKDQRSCTACKYGEMRLNSPTRSQEPPSIPELSLSPTEPLGSACGDSGAPDE